MKTGIYTPHFFLARKGLTIKVSTKTTIGRSSGTIILEDDELLSALHCEINPTIMEVTIKDLDSTNGVYVNKQKIFPNTQVKLNRGDEVKIGSDTYIFCDKEADAKKIDPPSDRRRNPRARNLYALENLYNFYSAHMIFRFIYLLVLLGAMTSTFLNMELEVPVPQNLSMLSKFYTDQILLSGLKVIFIVWALSLLHSLALHLYFNRNPLRKIFSLAVYGLLLFWIVDFKHGPLGGVKNYLTARHGYEQIDNDTKAIIQLKSLIYYKDSLSKGYKFTKRILADEDQKILEDDYKTIEKKITKKISKVQK